MSIESAEKFCSELKNDANLSKELSNCSDARERQELVRAKGYDFTVEEFKKVQSELSDEDLEKVAGGSDGHYCLCADLPGDWDTFLG